MDLLEEIEQCEAEIEEQKEVLFKIKQEEEDGEPPSLSFIKDAQREMNRLNDRLNRLLRQQSERTDMEPSPSFAKVLQKKEQSITGKRSPSVRTIEELVKEGKSLAAIGNDYGVSRQRISQILKDYGFSVEQIRPTVKRGVKCPKCQSDRVHSHGQTDAGNDRFLCLSCEKTFTILKPKPKKKPLSNVERQRRFQARRRLAKSVDNPTP